jgi:hypothetical protein
MSIPSDAWQVIGAIFAGMVAGLVSFLVTILAKEQKTSEFRQAWIDSLRQDLSDFASASIFLTDSLRLLADGQNSAAGVRDHLLKDRYPEVKQIEAARIRVLLRLNPVEHIKLIGLIDSAYSYSAERDEETDSLAGMRLVSDFIAESQEVLKFEWKRVKRGETIFLITKWISLVAFVVSFIFAVAYWRGHFIVKYLA